MDHSRSSDNYYSLGLFHRPVSTSSKEAQLWFNQGLVWAYGFNHEEAARCFEEAIRYDEQCAMAHWGLALVLGPNYNKPRHVFDDDERKEARPLHHPSRRRWLRQMLRDDLDVVTLYADALINLAPWELWNIKTGRPAFGSRALEAKEVLDRALAQKSATKHPGLLHLYIHLMEMSPAPENAMEAAEHLRGLVPDAGHLNHMPTHIDILCGGYRRAMASNLDAVRADESFLARQGPVNFYTLYRSHNYHFRIYAAMFAGQLSVALDTAQHLEDTIPPELLLVPSPPMAELVGGIFISTSTCPG